MDFNCIIYKSLKTNFKTFLNSFKFNFWGRAGFIYPLKNFKGLKTDFVRSKERGLIYERK